MKRQTPLWFILLSLCAALLLSVMPLPTVLQYVRPYWVLLVLLYWCLYTPDRVGMLAAFLMGGLLDLLLGDVLGLHAIGLCITMFLCMRARAQLRAFPLWQQTGVIVGLLINERIITLIVIVLARIPLPDWHIWLGPLIGLLIWPVLTVLLDDCRYRLRKVRP